jgi:MoaA/NifB/PqqE/SkfB family radical SAM enzyme
MKKERNLYFPELWFHYIIGSHNKHELIPYIEMIHKLGVDVTCIQVTKLLHEYPEIKEWCIDITEQEKQAAINRGKELGIQVTFNINTSEKAPMDDCSVWIQPFIFVDGTVVPCCSLNEQNDRPWQKETSLGNCLKEDLKTIWEGKKYKEMIDAIQQNKKCSSCARCILHK